MRVPATRLDNRFVHTLWALGCVTSWAWLARDQLTIIFCAVATVPYSVMLLRESRGQLETNATQMVAATLGFLSLLELVMLAVTLWAGYDEMIDSSNATSTVTSTTILALTFALAWFAASAYAEGLVTLFFVRTCESVFLMFWLLGVLALYTNTFKDSVYQLAFLSSLPTLVLVGFLLFSRRILIWQEGTAR